MDKVNQIFMLLIYNLLQILLLTLLSPVLLAVVLLTGKYRGMVWRRLGGGLSAAACSSSDSGARIWVHALSVGEVSSARALVRAIKREFPDRVLIFSASTRSGFAYAESVLSEEVDLLVAFPLDIYWVVEKFILTLKPELFVLVETDLWPNFLAALERHGIKAFLANGRISAASAKKYHRFRLFFTPLFNVFDKISMQTARDVERLKELGVDEVKLLSLGNLKYGAVDIPEGSQAAKMVPVPEGRMILVAGSSHSGEEDIVLDVYKTLGGSFPDLFLVIAPRDIERGRDIVAIARKKGLKASLRSDQGEEAGDLLVLDTLGELASVYEKCGMAFIGGSLVREGGHNPLEAATLGKPVVFGPHMDDFSEVAEELIKVGGAFMVENRESMHEVFSGWLVDKEARIEAGKKAARLVRERREVTAGHLDIIKQLLSGGGNG